MNFEDFLKTVSIEQLKTVPERIAIFYVVDSKHYHSLVNDVNRVSEKTIIDNEITKFRLSNDYIGNYTKDDLKIYVKSYNFSKKFAEKKIMEYLRSMS